MILILLLVFCGFISATTPPAEFAPHTIAAGLTGGTQVVIADLNRDGKPDIIAVTSKELVWFENPTWKPHVLASGLSGMSNLAAWDIDGDGIPELVLAHEYDDNAKNSLGILSVLKHGEDPRQPWKITEIDRIPTSHLLRWVNLSGDGRTTLINAPLSGPKAEPPDYRGKTSLVMYRPGAWMRETISEEVEGAIRGLFVTDWAGGGREEFLTAGSSGIHQFQLGQDGAWRKIELVNAESAGVAAGSLGRRAEKAWFVASLEPWPGTQIAIYKQDGKGGWRRQIIDAGLTQGGALLTADLNGDGNDEIISSDAGQSHGVNIYYTNGVRGDRWYKSVLDSGGIATSGCAVGDLNADGQTDIVCVSSASGMLMWYENKGLRKPH